MFDTLPEEIINLIFNNLEENNPFKYDMGKVSFLKMDINFILSLKGVNRFFKRYIEEKKGIWVHINKNNYLESYQNIDQSSRAILDSRSSQINDLCLKKTPCHVFTWLMDNNIVLSLKNIQSLIIKNRVDVIHNGFHYQEFLKTIFNKFHLATSNDIFGLSQNTSPMITAVKHDRVEIVKLLLESSSYGNPFIDQIENIFIETIKYIHRETLSYLIINHSDSLSKTINIKFSSLIMRFNNIEDILFYIVVNRKANVTRDTMKSLISKNYIELFQHCYVKYGYDQFKNNSDLLLKCIEYNSFVLFDYLMSKNSYIHPSVFSSQFLSKRKHNILFVNMILDKYLNLIPLKEKLIKLCIREKIDDKRITNLIVQGYHYDEKDIIEVLNVKKIGLAKTMINSYSNIS